MYYLQSRYYNPVVGRFVNGDSVEYLSADPYKIGNIFSYCNNACVCCSDDSGFDAGYITRQSAEPYGSMKLSRNVTVGEAGCGAVAVYNVLHSFSKKVNFKQILPVIMNAPPTVGPMGLIPVFGPVNWLYNRIGKNGVSIFSIITYLKWKFFWVRYSLGSFTYFWGIMAELGSAIIVAYMRPDGGHYVAGIKCGEGVGGVYQFYNSDWVNERKKLSIWQYLDIMKKNKTKPLAIISVSLKKGWW